MATQPEIPLETLHGQWCDAVTAALGDHLVPTEDTAPGYEHTWATRVAPGEERARRLLVVCPWHWPAYSHYQFWELAAVPWLARRAGYRDWCLVTNGAWTDWVLPALDPIFGRVIVADTPPIEEIRGWLAERPERRTVRLPRDRPAGRVLLGEATPRQTTVTLKAALARELGRRGITGRKLPTRRVEATLRPNFVVEDDGCRPGDHGDHGRPVLVYTKSFRNPDVVHEAKMLMGRALLSPDDTRPVVVVDGRWRDAPGLIARSGADVCTADRLPELLADIG